jgi:hypothetical protein
LVEYALERVISVENSFTHPARLSEIVFCSNINDYFHMESVYFLIER